MTLKIATEENPNKENTKQLVEAYLKNVVREMYRVDSVTRMHHKEPNRSVEEHAARQYMTKNPLHVTDKAAANQVIEDAEKQYRDQTDKAGLRTKIDYKLGSAGKARATAAIVMGAATALGGIAIARGASPEIGVSIIAAVGLTYIAADTLIPRKRNAEKAVKCLNNLQEYTRAKQALLALKMIKKALNEPKRPKPVSPLIAAAKAKNGVGAR